MSRKNRTRGRVGAPPWVWALPLLLGLVLVGYGLVAARAERHRARAAAIGTAPPIAPVDDPGARVTPGALTLTKDAPTDTTAPADAPCSGCDIVLVTVCSLRKDYVSAYGVHEGLTPGMDAVAREGFRFDRVYAASNFTLASLTATLTGRFGSSTGVTGWDKGLVADVPTLPEVLGLYGYTTAAFTIDAASGFRPDYGLDRGFQRMEIISPPRGTPDGRFGPGEPGPGGETAAPLVKWMAEQPKDKPLFAMLHTRTAHYPFVLGPPDGDDPTGVREALWEQGAPKGLASTGPLPGSAGGTAQRGAVGNQGGDPIHALVRSGGAPAVQVWRDAYAEAVARADVDIRKVLEAVAARGRPTIVVIVGDHGESLWDHDEPLHGDAYFDSVVNVPLVMEVPGIAPHAGAVPALLSQVDILPTLLDLVGAVKPAGIDGTSFLPVLRGQAEGVRTMTLVEGGVAQADASEMLGAVIALPWTFLHQAPKCGTAAEAGPRQGRANACLFDVATDPAQEHDVAGAHTDIVDGLLGRWKAFRDSKDAHARELQLDPAFIQTLHQSGYDFRAKDGR